VGRPAAQGVPATRPLQACLPDRQARPPALACAQGEGLPKKSCPLRHYHLLTARQTLIPITFAPENMAKNTYKKKQKESGGDSGLSWEFLKDRRLHLATGWFLLISSVFLFVSFISHLRTGQADQSVVENLATNGFWESSREVRNFFGIWGAWAAHVFIFKWFGLASFLIPPYLFLLGVYINWDKVWLPLVRTLVFNTFYLLWLSAFFGYFLLGIDGPGTWGFLCGGVGYHLASLLHGLIGWATVLALLFLLLVFNMFFFNITHIPIVANAWNALRGMVLGWFGKKQPEPEAGPVLAKDELSALMEQVKREVEEEDGSLEFEVKNVQPANKTVQPEWSIEERKPEKMVSPDNLQLELEEEPEENQTFTLPPVTPKPVTTKAREDLMVEGMEVEKAEFQEKEATEQLVNYDPTLDLPGYKFPTPDLLTDYPKKETRVTKDELEQNKNRIVETLINFKIGIQSIKATIGPTVTLYEIVPQAGVKISKIKNLEDDIALSLSALGIRIIAPIPGRGTIGIEVPNKNREMVDVKSVITTEKFMMSDGALPIVLGKTISNEVFVTDLSKMPHLLMAGATGQGKSVGLNMVLTSLLYKKHPSQLKFVLVDPKKVELTLFNTIERHFLAKLPDSEEAIITDTSKVVNTLNSLCIEMDTRYDLLKLAACRTIKEYNKKFEDRRLNPQKGHKYLPYIVLVIDELADLMMTAGKEVEAPIARLAQLARAIGIHLIVATQRPSVNVITGIIKANFPARLSFRVTSKVDSRTILDAGGADQLIGAGDMLLSMGSEMIRLQCAFVDTPEIERICEFIGSQRGYDSAYMLPEYVGDEESGVGDVDLSERDALFADAARLIVLHQQGSTSLIQRKMKLGYNRAGRLIDQLEAAGVVGPFEGSKAREVLIQDEYALEQLLKELDSKY
jgi:DNA segregation ATPase FtsK/SpoIIIE, S-DNA-T family